MNELVIIKIKNFRNILIANYYIYYFLISILDTC